MPYGIKFFHNGNLNASQVRLKLWHRKSVLFLLFSVQNDLDKISPSHIICVIANKSRINYINNECSVYLQVSCLMPIF